MNTFRFAFVLGSLASLTTFAQEPAIEPQSTASVADNEIVDVYSRPLQLTLSPGLIAFETRGGTGETRLTMGAEIARDFSPDSPTSTPIQFGGRTGLIYSHLGSPGASFVGTGGGGGSDGGNLFVVPLHVWAGYHWEGAKVLTSIHTGADLFMQTRFRSLETGRDSRVNFFPVFGFQAGWDTGQNFAVNFQGGWTLAPQNAIFNGMLGVTVPLA